MVEKIIIGNIITMNTANPFAEAMLIENGRIKYVGSESDTKKFSNNPEIMDYKGKYIYPGFIDSHVHPIAAGDRIALQVNLSSGSSMKEYVSIMEEYIKAHPDNSMYRGAGWAEKDVKPNAGMLDEICNDVPVILNSFDGHSLWMNTKAMEVFGVNADLLKKYGPNVIRVDENGKITGYISEKPAIDILQKCMSMISSEESADSMMQWQNFAFSNGITAVQDAGVSSSFIPTLNLLKNNPDWKLRTYYNYILSETDNRPVSEMIKDVVHFSEKVDYEYYKLTGIKVFVDGVIEGHTAWMIDDYLDTPSYNGVKRFCDIDKLSEIVCEASRLGYYVHAHCIGDMATKNTLDAYKKGQLMSGNPNQRNCIAHLEVVCDEDIKRFAELGVVAIVPPLWTSINEKSTFKLEEKYIGHNKAMKCYPIKSFIDAGAVINYHTDYPISSVVNIPLQIYMAAKRKSPDDPDSLTRNISEAVTPFDSLKAMTINAAYQLGQDKEIGSIEAGKIANVVVYDTDFLNEDIEKIPDAKLIATIIDGDIVFGI